MERGAALSPITAQWASKQQQQQQHQLGLAHVGPVASPILSAILPHANSAVTASAFIAALRGNRAGCIKPTLLQALIRRLSSGSASAAETCRLVPVPKHGHSAAARQQPCSRSARGLSTGGGAEAAAVSGAPFRGAQLGPAAKPSAPISGGAPAVAPTATPSASRAFSHYSAGPLTSTFATSAVPRASLLRMQRPRTAPGCSAPVFRSYSTSGRRRSSAAAWPAVHQQWAHVQRGAHSVLDALGPYRGCLSWKALATLYRQTYNCLPVGLPGLRQAHYYLLSAINVLGSHLPVTLAVAVAELARSSRTAKAESFAYYLDLPSHELPALPWYVSLPLQLYHGAISVMRSLWLLVLFGPVLLTAPVALSLQFKRAEWMELLRKSLEAAGPAFIKWGQWAATRHDLFPPDMCAELELLHSKAPAHKFRHTRKAIEEAFGVPVLELFESIEEEPVASGSIGQIHRATLSDKGAAVTGVAAGTTVAVKVRHPGVGAAILRDFATMMAVAHLANMMPSLRHLRLEETLSQFAAPLREQVDLSREAANLRRFNHNFRKTQHVFFPVPLYPLVTSDVLVETYEEGDHITYYIQSERNPYNHRLSELGSGTMLQMMLVDNLIHSDLHPGNILVRLDPPRGLLGALYKGLDSLRYSASLAPATRARIELLQQRWLQPSLVLLDVGMATELTPVDQTNMVGLFRSFASLDGRACGDWTLRFSGPEQSCPDPDAFRADMERTFAALRSITADNGTGWTDSSTFKSGADALASVLELVRQYKVSLPGHICAVVVTTLVLEGWSNKLDPDHSVLTQVKTMFEPEHMPWSARITALVDKVMEDEENHFALA